MRLQPCKPAEAFTQSKPTGSADGAPTPPLRSTGVGKPTRPLTPSCVGILTSRLFQLLCNGQVQGYLSRQIVLMGQDVAPLGLRQHSSQDVGASHIRHIYEVVDEEVAPALDHFLHMQPTSVRA